MYTILCVVAISMGILVITYYEPFDNDQAKHFLYCYVASLVWSLVVGEIVPTPTLPLLSTNTESVGVPSAASREWPSPEIGAVVAVLDNPRTVTVVPIEKSGRLPFAEEI